MRRWLALAPLLVACNAGPDDPGVMYMPEMVVSTPYDAHDRNPILPNGMTLQAPPEGSRATDDKGGATMIGRWMRDDVLERVQLLKPIADEAGLTLAQLAVAWVLQNPNVSAAIVGASRPEQVTDNAKASGVTLDEATLKAIDEIVEPVVERDPGKTQQPRRSDFS